MTQGLARQGAKREGIVTHQLRHCGPQHKNCVSSMSTARERPAEAARNAGPSAAPLGPGARGQAGRRAGQNWGCACTWLQGPAAGACAVAGARCKLTCSSWGPGRAERARSNWGLTGSCGSIVVSEELDLKQAAEGQGVGTEQRGSGLPDICRAAREQLSLQA